MQKTLWFRRTGARMWGLALGTQVAFGIRWDQMSGELTVLFGPVELWTYRR